MSKKARSKADDPKPGAGGFTSQFGTNYATPGGEGHRVMRKGKTQRDRLKGGRR